MKIINFHAENFKRLRAVDITPQGNMVVLSGANEQGKSSVLDAIMAALAGGRGMKSIPEPVRHGEQQAKVHLDLGDLRICRTWDSGGASKVEVTNSEKHRLATPQAILDALIGELAFDPLEFARMQPRNQRKTLQKLTGIDVDALDADRAALLSDIQAVTNEYKRAKSNLDNAPTPPASTPDSEISASDIMREMHAANELQNKNSDTRRNAKQLLQEVSETALRIGECDGEISRLRKQIADIETKRGSLDAQLSEKKNALEEADEAVEKLMEPDMAAIAGRAIAVEETNQHVRDKQLRRKLLQEVDIVVERGKVAKAALAAHDKNKQDKLAAAEYPIEGLAFCDDGILFNGIPFAQCSESQRIMVSAAIGAALNPKLRVMFIRDGSLLDKKRMEALGELAKEKDIQCWVEVVDESGEVGICIEDGAIR